MLIAHGLLPDLISQLSSYSFFGIGIAPIYWDQGEGQFKVKKSAMTCIGTVITLQLGLCLAVHDFYRQYQGSVANGISLAAINGADSGGAGGDSVMDKAYNRIQRMSCILVLFFVATVHGKNMRSAHALATFFNGLISFEQKYTGRIRLPIDWKGKLTKYFCLLVRLSNNIGPLLISVLITVSEPSSPLNIFEFLSSSASSSSGEMSVDGGNGNNGGNNDLGTSSSFSGLSGNQMVDRFISATIMALLNLIVWYMVLNIRGFWTCGQILIGCYGVRSALNLYSSIMTRGKLLRITKEKIQEALIYREIQLLGSLFNEVQGNSIFTCLLLLSSLVQTVSLYLYVGFIATMTSSFYFLPSSWTWTSSRLFIAYMVFDGIFTVFVVFGCCAEVYITSVQVKDQLQGNEVFQRSEWLTQFFLSCSTIKLEAGSTNFIWEGKLHCSVAGDGHDSQVNGGLGNGGGRNPSPSPALSISSSDLMNMMMTMNIGNGFGESGSIFSSPHGKITSATGASSGNGNFCAAGGNVNSISSAMTLQSGIFDM